MVIGQSAVMIHVRVLLLCSSFSHLSRRMPLCSGADFEHQWANRGHLSGRISSYKKDDLRSLALALGVSDKDGKKELRLLPGLKRNLPMNRISRRKCDIWVYLIGIMSTVVPMPSRTQSLKVTQSLIPTRPLAEQKARRLHRLQATILGRLLILRLRLRLFITSLIIILITR